MASTKHLRTSSCNSRLSCTFANISFFLPRCKPLVAVDLQLVCCGVCLSWTPTAHEIFWRNAGCFVALGKNVCFFQMLQRAKVPQLPLSTGGCEHQQWQHNYDTELCLFGTHYNNGLWQGGEWMYKDEMFRRCQRKTELLYTTTPLCVACCFVAYPPKSHRIIRFDDTFRLEEAVVVVVVGEFRELPVSGACRVQW